MPTAKPRDPQATKHAVIEAAGRLFAEKGFAGVTAREVARDAGVALSAIPYHFGSMDALYREALLRACEASPNAAPLATQALMSEPQAGLRMAVRWAVVDASEFAASWPIRLLYREELDPSPMYKEVLQLKVVPEWNWLREVIARATELPVDAPQVKFGVIVMYNLTASLHTRGGMIDHLAPDITASITTSRESYIECMALLTLDAVARYGAAMKTRDKRAPKPGEPKTSGARGTRRGAQSGGKSAKR
jgi:AcrR family transcriptional regulator